MLQVSEIIREKSKLADVHARGDERQISINEVGVSEIRYPIVVKDREGKSHHTVGSLSMSVDLAHDLKGAHMSRFIEVLNEYCGSYNVSSMPELLLLMQDRLKSERARVEVSFPYFLSRVAPVSGLEGKLDYACTIRAETRDGLDDIVLKVAVPVTALCPCSKEISDYGAHNQRSIVSMEVRTIGGVGEEREGLYVEELIEIAEGSASAPVYPILKRIDERYVTMQAYDNPVFVEDLVRGVSGKLMEDERIEWFRVHVENFESIHNHNAYACIDWSR